MRRILSLLYTLIFIICIYPHPAKSVDGTQLIYNCPLCSDSNQTCGLTGLTPSCGPNPENGEYKPCCLYSNGACTFGTCKLKCNLGYIALGSSCNICPAGSYCPSGATKLTECPAGKYSNEGAFICTDCPAPYTTGAAGTGVTIYGCSVQLTAGYYVSNGKVTSCPAGFYCPGGKTYYSDNSDNGATECPADSYCPAGTSKPIQCPDLTPYSRAGAKSADDCFSCSPGTYRDETVTECTTCPVGHYCKGGKKEACPAGRYNDQTGQSSCKECPGGTYNAQTGQTQCTQCPDINDHKATQYPARWYASEGNIEINSVNNPKWDSLTGKKAETDCVGNYNVSGPRGKFTHEVVGYNSRSKKYDNFEVGSLYYWAPNPGFYLTEKLSETYCDEGGQYMYYRDSKLCEAGKYCLGRNNKTSCDYGQYEDTLGQDGNIAAGYFSNGGATSAQPNSTTINGGTGCVQSNDCPTGGCYCGYVAPGHYSTGGGTLFSPSGPGNGCLDDFDCGAIAAGYYSTGGAPSKIPANCVSGGECGKLAGGHFATCGAKKKNPTVPQSGTNPDCATGCECGYTDEGYYSSGGGTKYNPNGVGDGCLTGFQCGPCNSEKKEICPRGSSSTQTCEAGKYCQISGTQLIKNNCPVGTRSNAGSDDITDCFIYGGKSGTNFCIRNEDRTKIDNCFNLPNNTIINLKSAN